MPIFQRQTTIQYRAPKVPNYILPVDPKGEKLLISDFTDEELTILGGMFTKDLLRRADQMRSQGARRDSND